MSIPFLLAAVLFLAYTNGANDNFKGVATLFGSRTADYRGALAWATVTTFAGSLTALWVSQGLVKAFSGKGLVPAALTGQPQFLLAVGLGAALTVFLATLTGFPISTTHALTGALVGTGWMAVGSQLNLEPLFQTFLLPLAGSPFIALLITAVLYPVFQVARAGMGIQKKLCLCIGSRQEPVLVQPDGTVVLQSTGITLAVGEMSECTDQYQGMLLGLESQRLLDILHYLSAGTVSFARGLNDTPKIVALLVAAQVLSLNIRTGLFLIAVAMAVGGILNARKVAQTMSQRITRINHGQGFTANLVTSFLVILASRWGLPVSTTHVSVGSLIGIGLVNRQADLRVIRNVVLSWLITLPVAAVLAGLIWWLA